MKVSGTGPGPTPDVSGTEAATPSVNRVEKKGEGKVEGAEASTTGRAFAEKLSGARPPQPSEQADQQAGQVVRTGQAARATDVAVGDVAAGLRAGKVTPQGAIDQVVEMVVAQQAGRDAPAAVRDQIRAALRNAIDDDPLLAAKLTRLKS